MECGQHGLVGVCVEQAVVEVTRLNLALVLHHNMEVYHVRDQLLRNKHVIPIHALVCYQYSGKSMDWAIREMDYINC